MTDQELLAKFIEFVAATDNEQTAYENYVNAQQQSLNLQIQIEEELQSRIS